MVRWNFVNEVTAIKVASSHVKILFALALLTISACATTFQPHKHSCEVRGMASVEAGKRESTNFASIVHPAGNWCFQGSDPKVGTYFLTNKFVGKYLESKPAEEEYLHTFVTAVRLYKVKDVDISNPEALKDFVQKWLEIGGGRATPIGGEFYAETTAGPQSERFELVDLVVREDDSFDAHCVWVEKVANDRDHPRFQNRVLKLSEEGYICRSPHSDRVLILAFFSERRFQGIEDVALASRLRGQAERAIKSLEFVNPDQSQN